MLSEPVLRRTYMCKFPTRACKYASYIEFKTLGRVEINALDHLWVEGNGQKCIVCVCACIQFSHQQIHSSSIHVYMYNVCTYPYHNSQMCRYHSDIHITIHTYVRMYVHTHVHTCTCQHFMLHECTYMPTFQMIM